MCLLIYRNAPAFYSWKISQGFNILPQSGYLAPKEALKLTATFCPVTAGVYNDFVTCYFSEKDVNCMKDSKIGDSIYTKVMKVEGVGKYPYIIVKCSESPKKDNHSLYANEFIRQISYVNRDSSENSLFSAKEVTLDFGYVGVGGSANKWIEVNNPSPVNFLVDIGGKCYGRHQSKVPVVYQCNITNATGAFPWHVN